MRSSPRYEHEWLRIMIEVRIAPVAAAQDTALVNELAALVNGVYALAEEGLWVNGTPRTTPERMAELMAAGQIAIAWADEWIVGAIRIQRLDTRELVRFAEHWSREQGLDTMQLEVLVPRQWSHPSKEFLTAWYARIGYRPVRTGPLEESYPELAPLLATPCDFVIYHKSLRTLPNDDALLSV